MYFISVIHKFKLKKSEKQNAMDNYFALFFLIT